RAVRARGVRSRAARSYRQCAPRGPFRKPGFAKRRSPPSARVYLDLDWGFSSGPHRRPPPAPADDETGSPHTQPTASGGIVIARPEGGPRIVVGVDDSAGARCALAWAIGAARLRRLPLLVVHAAPLPPHVSAAGQLGCGVTEALRTSGAELVARVLADVCGGPPEGVDLTALALIGEPGAVLVRLAGDDDILVVGHGTRGPLSRMLRPSVRL